MLTETLIKNLGLLRLKPKAEASNEITTVEPVATQPPATPKLDKSEFRLLVKMLQAINHNCEYDAIEYDGQVVKYRHPSKTLVFHDINVADTDEVMNLSSLTDILKNPTTKRPVWEKLKTL